MCFPRLNRRKRVLVAVANVFVFMGILLVFGTDVLWSYVSMWMWMLFACINVVIQMCSPDALGMQDRSDLNVECKTEEP